MYVVSSFSFNSRNSFYSLLDFFNEPFFIHNVLFHFDEFVYITAFLFFMMPSFILLWSEKNMCSNFSFPKLVEDLLCVLVCGLFSRHFCERLKRMCIL